MEKIFVVGKAGSGKSIFAQALAEELNINYINVDKIAHKIYENQDMVSKIKFLLGDIIDKNNVVDRKKIGRIIFSNLTSTNVKDFYQLTWRYIRENLDVLLKSGGVVDYALLSATDIWQENAIKIIIKANDDEKRVKMLEKRDNVDEEYIKLRDNACPKYVEEEFDFVVENDFKIDLKTTAKQIAQKIKNKITLKILGCHSPFCLEKQAGPSYLIQKGEDKILLDCGSGSHRFIDMFKIEDLNIFVSHLHKDHFNDIYIYQYSSHSLYHNNLLKKPINIFLPQFESNISKDIRQEHFAIARYFEINEDKNYKIGELNVSFCKVLHDEAVETYAIKVECGDKKIVYSADKSYGEKEKLIKFAQDADLFLCEATFLRENNKPIICGHLTAYQAGEIANLANAKRLVLTHFSPINDLNKTLKEASETFDKKINLAVECKEFYIF